MGLSDVHAHLTHPDLVGDEAGVLARARAAGVTTIISNGLNPADNQAVAALAAREPLVRPAFGLYPVDAVLPEMLAMGEEYPHGRDPVPGDEAVAWVRENVEDCFAVGEIGLDHYWVPTALWELQEARFRALVTIAMEADKAIIIHSRKAEAQTFEVLQEMGMTRVNWHCFSSKMKLGRRIAEAGHTLSIPANAHRAGNFRRLLEVLPRTQVLLETDCPYLSPERGETNEPANVALTAALAAELWESTPEAVEAQLSENFERLFGAAP